MLTNDFVELGTVELSDGSFTVQPTKHTKWLEQILQRCGRCNTLVKTPTGWEVRDAAGKLIDQDTDFNTLFHRHYDWEEDVPGYEGLLWRSPARMSGEVCLKDTRIPTHVIKMYVDEGEKPLEEWDYITQEQIDAAVRYEENLNGRR